MIRSLAILACLLTVCITGASAFIRHAQAGLGCDGRPGCLQQTADASPGTAATRASAAAGTARDSEPGPSVDSPPVSTNPSRAVVVARMLHRVSASVVGLLAIGLLVFGWNGLPRSGRVAAIAALLISAFLAWLGRFTPHPLPWVTLGNVGGGFALIAAFACVAACRAEDLAWTSGRPRPAGLAIVAGALLAVLLWLGLMIGARDAIAACPSLLCLDGARFDVSAFDPALAQANASQGSGQALHLAHRFVALAFVLVVAMLVRRAWLGGRRALAAVLAAMLAAQIALGLTTAVGGEQSVSATLHNVIAALWAALLATLAMQSSIGGAAIALSAVDQRNHAHHDQDQAHQAQ